MNDILRRRIQDWKDQDPSSLLTRKIEKATEPLQWLVALMLPETLIIEVTKGTLWAAEALTDRAEVLKTNQATSLEQVQSVKIDHCDRRAEEVQNWAVAAAAALGAWDLAGPLGMAPALASLFTLAFRTIKKIGLCHGFDTSSASEEMIVLHIFVAASTLYHRDKVQALKAIEKIIAEPVSATLTRETVEALVDKLAKTVGTNLTKRRAFASVPALGALVGSSNNAWLLHDVGWAARNIYAQRRLELKAVAREKAKEAKT